MEELVAGAKEFYLWAISATDEIEERYLLLASTGVYEPALLFDRYPEVLASAKADPTIAWKAANMKKAVEKGILTNQPAGTSKQPQKKRP